jgi:HSP20 family molecular chaperone IbpA
MPTQHVAAEPSVQWEPVPIVEPDSLLSHLHELHTAIATRAYELSEERGHLPGNDWDNWFRAEAEFLRPVAVHVSESEGAISVIAQVLGFSGDELQISVEPFRLIVAGKKKGGPEFTGTKTIYVDWVPDEILRVVPLPAEVIPTRAIAKTQAGLLEVEIPKMRLIPWPA